MSKDLTNSSVDRQNILNNHYAQAEIEKAAGIQSIPFEGKTMVLKEQVAGFFEVTPVQRDDYERFLGEKSKELAERLEDAKDVMERLKERK